LGISPASVASSAGEAAAAACFVQSVSRFMPKQGIWLGLLLIIVVGISCRRSRNMRDFTS